MTAATMGAGGAAVAGVHGLDAAADGAHAVSAANRMDDVVGVGSKLDDLGHADDLADLGRVHLDDVPDWTHGRDIDPDAPGSDLYPDGYDRYGGLGEQQFYDRYWDPDAENWVYPGEADGFPGGFDGEIRPNALEVGDLIDRFGRPGGEYASPAGTPFEQRSLPPSSVGGDYHQYEVLRPLPESVTEGKIAQWFEQPGGGLQYKFDQPLEWYVKHGFLREVG